MVRKQDRLNWNAHTHRLQKKNYEDNRTAKENTRPLPGLTDDLGPTEYWRIKNQPDNIRARAAEANVAFGRLFLAALKMYDANVELRWAHRVVLC